MKPKLINDKWYIEVYTKEFGDVLLLDASESLTIPITFNTEEAALNYLKYKQQERQVLYKHSWYTLDQGMGLQCDKCDAYINLYDNDFLEREAEESCFVSDKTQRAKEGE